MEVTLTVISDQILDFSNLSHKICNFTFYFDFIKNIMYILIFFIIFRHDWSLNIGAIPDLYM